MGLKKRHVTRDIFGGRSLTAPHPPYLRKNFDLTMRNRVIFRKPLSFFQFAANPAVISYFFPVIYRGIQEAVFLFLIRRPLVFGPKKKTNFFFRATWNQKKNFSPPENFSSRGSEVAKGKKVPTSTAPPLYILSTTRQ